VPHLIGANLNLGKPNAFKRVAITVDFGAKDEASIRHALNLGGPKAHYFLIHIVESAAALKHGAEVMDEETYFDTQTIQRYTNQLSSEGYQVQYQMGFGNRAENISKIVKDSRVELLVMGAHGHKGIYDLIFGSTVDVVRHKVDIPVLVVK
jgi:manganese transport protein